VTVSPVDRAAEAGGPDAALSGEVDVSSAWSDPFAPVETPSQETAVGDSPAPRIEGVATPQADGGALEGANGHEELLIEPEPARSGMSQVSETATAMGGQSEESPAAMVTPRATWERGFAGPPETVPPADQDDEPLPPVIIDPLLRAAPPIPSAPPAPSPTFSSPAPAVPVAPPAPPAPPLPPALAAVLDEAELYLLPQWADHEAALRLLEQAEREAPEHPRVRDLRARLEAAQGGGDNSAQLAALLEQADRSFKDQDYWAAVDHYEQILSEEPEHEDALAGIARARLRARWPTRLAGASGDSTALRILGDDAATEAPDLAGQAYAAAFAIQPGVDVLRGWLIAFVHAGHGEVLPGTARRAVKVLEERGKILPAPAVAEALDGLDQAAAGDPAEMESAVNRLCDALVSATP
jgi:tetratricopeptide (TPR) repeat protein